MPIQPLRDNILVKRNETEDTTAGGIYVPPTAQIKTQKGTVISIGEGKRTESGALMPSSLKEGDIVLFGKYSGTEISFEGQEYLIMREEDVLAIL